LFVKIGGSVHRGFRGVPAVVSILGVFGVERWECQEGFQRFTGSRQCIGCCWYREVVSGGVSEVYRQ